MQVALVGDKFAEGDAGRQALLGGRGQLGDGLLRRALAPIHRKNNRGGLLVIDLRGIAVGIEERERGNKRRTAVATGKGPLGKQSVEEAGGLSRHVLTLAVAILRGHAGFQRHVVIRVDLAGKDIVDPDQIVNGQVLHLLVVSRTRRGTNHGYSHNANSPSSKEMSKFRWPRPARNSSLAPSAGASPAACLC